MLQFDGDNKRKKLRRIWWDILFYEYTCTGLDCEVSLFLSFHVGLNSKLGYFNINQRYIYTLLVYIKGHSFDQLTWLDTTKPRGSVSCVVLLALCGVTTSTPVSCLFLKMSFPVRKQVDGRQWDFFGWYCSLLCFLFIT